ASRAEEDDNIPLYVGLRKNAQQQGVFDMDNGQDASQSLTDDEKKITKNGGKYRIHRDRHDRAATALLFETVSNLIALALSLRRKGRRERERNRDVADNEARRIGGVTSVPGPPNKRNDPTREKAADVVQRAPATKGTEPQQRDGTAGTRVGNIATSRKPASEPPSRVLPRLPFPDVH
ncbi:hypothetical protein BaRGS_00007722, partial [Batillaria attramentaria]